MTTKILMIYEYFYTEERLVLGVDRIRTLITRYGNRFYPKIQEIFKIPRVSRT